MKKKIIFTVTNDLAYDQRMQRICSTLAVDYDIELVGREINNSQLTSQTFRQTRLKCFFAKGKLFYAEINIRLFFYLLCSKADIICAIDLDTIMPGFIVAKFKRIPLVYDAHEYYTEVIELVSRPREQRIWQWVEKTFVPRTKYAYTVSASLQNIFTKKYNVPFDLIRNISVLKAPAAKSAEQKYLIYAGAVNAGRGVAEIIMAMQQISMPLYICGTGDVLEEMKELTKKLGLQDKVIFYGNVSPAQLDVLIANAFAGFLLLENKGLSYYYSLANKFFDYIHGEIPQITINFPEYQLLNSEYKVAVLIDLQIEEIVTAVNKLATDEVFYNHLVDNCKIAKQSYNWQTEATRLNAFYKQICY